MICSNFLPPFFRIILPVSTPIIATLTLFYGVGHWNEYFSALIYISDPAKYTLQRRLQQLVLSGDSLQSYSASDFSNSADIPVESLKAAAIVFAAGHQPYEYLSVALYFCLTNWLYQRSGSLWVCIIIHGLTNMAIALLVKYGGMGWLW